MREVTAQSIPADVREVFERFSLSMQAELNKLDGAFLAQFSDAKHPETISLLKQYCLDRFDKCAEWLLPFAVSPDSLVVNAVYEQSLDALKEKTLEYLSTVLQSARSDFRNEVRSWVALRLKARTLALLGQAKIEILGRRSPPVVDLAALSAWQGAASTRAEAVDKAPPDSRNMEADTLRHQADSFSVSLGTAPPRSGGIRLDNADSPLSEEKLIEPMTTPARSITELTALIPAATAVPVQSVATSENIDSVDRPDTQAGGQITNELARRGALLQEYIASTGVDVRARIYRTAGVHRPDFYKWLNGKIPAQSKTSKKIERLLMAKTLPPTRD